LPLTHGGLRGSEEKKKRHLWSREADQRAQWKKGESRERISGTAPTLQLKPVEGKKGLELKTEVQKKTLSPDKALIRTTKGLSWGWVKRKPHKARLIQEYT